MKRVFALGFAGLIASVAMNVLATQSEWANYNAITDPADAQVDATNFVNFGTWNIFSTRPYETANTLNFTNHASMFGVNGWDFYYFRKPAGQAFGERLMASSFVNADSGTIEAGSRINSGVACLPQLYDPSYLLIAATNIIIGAGTSSGGSSLIVGPSGTILLVGSHVDLVNSGIEVRSPSSAANGSGWLDTARTFFQPDVGVLDSYWAQTNYSDANRLNTGALWNGLAASAPGVPSPPTLPVLTPAPGFNLVNPAVADSYIRFDPASRFTLTLTNFDGSFTNIQLASNIFKGAIFGDAPPGFNFRNGFIDMRGDTNYFMECSVVFSVDLSNSVAQGNDTAYVRVYDTLASDIRYRGLSTNIVGCDEPITCRPKNFLVDRSQQLIGGPGGNGFPDPDFFTSSGFAVNNPAFESDSVTNVTVNAGEFAAYGAFYDSLSVRPAPAPGGNETNFPGRVRIYADSLNLEDARISAQGQVFIQASHLVSSERAVINCENLSMSLSSTNGPLQIRNIAGASVQRLRGPIECWSATWINPAIFVITNNFSFTNTDTTGTNPVLVAVQTPLTNSVTVNFHATMVDARALQTSLPVVVYDMHTYSDETVIDDNISIGRRMLIDGRHITLNGNLTLLGAYPADPISGFVPPDPVVNSWNAALAPNMLDFTNHGTMSVPSEARFGDDRPLPYSSFINDGSITAEGITVNSGYIQNNGLLSGSAIRFQGNIAKFESGSSSSGNDTRIETTNAKFRNYQISAGLLVLNVSGDLSDAGSTSGNTFQLRNGINLTSKPKAGDLLGTTINSVATGSPSSQPGHTWGATDFGPSAAGFKDNVAIGRLNLQVQSANAKFRFFGVGTKSAMYVDLLDLSSLTNLATQLSFAPNITVYYAAARLGFAPPLLNGAIQSPEEYLDGQFGGRLRWVKTYAGANSTRIVNGLQVNRALADSRIIDSDGDGSVNFIDATPFQTAAITVLVNGNGKVSPNYNGQLLIVDSATNPSPVIYSMTALPNDGSVFTGWSGSTSSVSSTLTFIMASNMAFTANFAFAPASATYRGLFYEPSGVQFLKSGYFTASTAPSRSVSGSLQMGIKRYSFRGQLSTTGAATIIIPRPGTNALTLQLQAGTTEITGTITDGSWTANLTADRAVFSAAKPSPYAGKYTLSLPGSDDPTDTTVPHGDGYGAVTVASAGSVSLRGALADGAIVSQSSAVSQDGQWPLYLSLYSGKGQILGWMTFANTGEADVDGLVSWFKQPSVTKYYPAGFDVETSAFGSLYNSKLSPATGFSQGDFLFSGGNLAADFGNHVAFNAKNGIVNFGSNKLTFILRPDGTFTGNVTDPASGKSKTYNGVLLQKQEMGAGYFLGTNQSGKVIISP